MNYIVETTVVDILVILRKIGSQSSPPSNSPFLPILPSF